MGNLTNRRFPPVVWGGLCRLLGFPAKPVRQVSTTNTFR